MKLKYILNTILSQYIYFQTKNTEKNKYPHKKILWSLRQNKKVTKMTIEKKKDLLFPSVISLLKITSHELNLHNLLLYLNFSIFTYLQYSFLSLVNEMPCLLSKNKSLPPTPKLLLKVLSSSFDHQTSHKEPLYPPMSYLHYMTISIL